MKKLLIVVGLVILLLVPVACGGSEEQSGGQITPVPTPAPADREKSETYDGSGALPSGEEQMIVRNGNISLVVEDVMIARDKIAQIAEKYDGYVVSSSIYGEAQDRRGITTIRVANDMFEPALAELRELAVEVESESTSSQDVTEEYIDLQSRLGNAEATEKQYLALLEQAEDVDDILNIYKSLSEVRYEIEQIKGRMQYLERTSAMSMITVYTTSAKPIVGSGWNILEVLKSAVSGLVTAGKVLGNIAIWLIIFVPIWGTALAVIYWRLRRRKKA